MLSLQHTPYTLGPNHNLGLFFPCPFSTHSHPHPPPCYDHGIINPSTYNLSTTTFYPSFCSLGPFLPSSPRCIKTHKSPLIERTVHILLTYRKTYENLHSLRVHHTLLLVQNIHLLVRLTLFFIFGFIWDSYLNFNRGRSLVALFTLSTYHILTIATWTTIAAYIYSTFIGLEATYSNIMRYLQLTTWMSRFLVMKEISPSNLSGAANV